MGGRPPSVEAVEVMRAIALHPEPVVTAADIHEMLDLTTDGARERMKKLVTNGYLESKKVGSSGLVFWMTDEGKKLLNEAFD